MVIPSSAARPRAQASFPRLVQKLLSTGRGAVVETGGLVAGHQAYLAPLLQRFGRGETSVRALVVVESLEEMSAIAEPEADKASRKTRRTVLVRLGEAEDLRRELASLAAGPSVLVGTAARVIDHLRRGNLQLADALVLTAECPPGEARPGFFADLEFILAKMPSCRQVLVFGKEMAPPLPSFLRRTRLLGLEAWLSPLPAAWWLTPGQGQLKSDALAALCLAYRHRPVVLIEASKSARARLKTTLVGRGVQADLAETVGTEGEFRRGCCISADPDGWSLKAGRPVFVFISPPREDHLNIALLSGAELIIMAEEASSPEAIQEMLPVRLQKKETPADEEVLKGLIRTLVDRIKHEAAPEELNYFRGLVRRNVSIFERSYFAAYLLKLYHEGTVPETGKRPKGRPERRVNAPDQAPSKGMVNLFIGIGKNRKVYPRDLSALVSGVQGIARAHVGEIKILDNYSFVEVVESMAPTVISALNGKEFRGRKLAVNFARKKEEAST